MLTLLALALCSATPELRQEKAVDFAVDDAFQRKGGVQYFFEQSASVRVPAEGSTLAKFRPLDVLATLDDKYHVTMSRLVYTVDRDVSFFTEARARDVSYIQRVAPDMGVVALEDGSFKVNKTPSNRFTLTWLGAPKPTDAALQRFFELVGATPSSVVVQKNFDFARVMGWRTGERSYTYTAHVALERGKTRVVVCSISLLHHVPPFFLGGAERIKRESVAAAAALIQQLRDYDGP